MSALRTAYVYVRGAFAGTLAETDEGYAFAYDPQYLTFTGEDELCSSFFFLFFPVDFRRVF